MIKYGSALRKFSQFSQTSRKDFPCVFSDLTGHGYLPNVKPLQALPSEFSQVNEILDKMTYWQPDGTATGLLAKNQLRKTVDSELPNLIKQIEKVDQTDARLNAALFRDYSFLAAAYMLESCHINHVQGNGYGIGASKLPEQVAVPLAKMAHNVRYNQPLLEYAYGYGLYNWALAKDPHPEVLTYDNLDLLPPTGESVKQHMRSIRLFNGCTDENGFIVMHVAIETQSHKLVQGQ